MADQIERSNRYSPYESLPSMPGRALGDRTQLSEEIAVYVRDLVMSGHLRAGRQLNIEALARQLKTSATPVREALLALRGEGFVEMEPRRGFRIAPLSRQDVEDMFFVQSLIAGELAGRGAELSTESFLKELVRVQERMEEADARSDEEEIEELNHEFHRMINRMASSPKLTWLLGVVVRYVPRIFFSTISGWHEASLRDHAAIIESIRNKDHASARQAMTTHIKHAGELLVLHLENQGFWSTHKETSVR